MYSSSRPMIWMSLFIFHREIFPLPHGQAICLNFMATPQEKRKVSNLFWCYQLIGLWDRDTVLEIFQILLIYFPICDWVHVRTNDRKNSAPQHHLINKIFQYKILLLNCTHTVLRFIWSVLCSVHQNVVQLCNILNIAQPAILSLPDPPIRCCCWAWSGVPRTATWTFLLENLLDFVLGQTQSRLCSDEYFKW